MAGFTGANLTVIVFGLLVVEAVIIAAAYTIYEALYGGRGGEP